jgi:hypothetical protein
MAGEVAVEVPFDRSPAARDADDEQLSGHGWISLDNSFDLVRPLRLICGGPF